MKGNDFFSGKSLKAEDLNGREPVVTISKVTTQVFDDGSRKPIIHFEGKEKTLVCNRTNWNSIVEITGEDDSDNWTGCRIKLIVARVDFQGKRVPAIRVEPPPARSTAQRQPPQPPQPVDDTPDDDSVPF